MYELPDGFTRRAPAVDDAQAVTDMIIAVDMDETGEPAFSIDDLKSI